MCYGPSVEQMGDAAISAAAGSVLQLERLQMTSTKLGVTPMIKKNDGNSGTFTLEDAVKLTEYSKGNSNISMLSFWQLSADFNLEYTYKFLGIDGTTMTPRLSTNVCGIDWTDAATTCAIACPSGTDSECPTGQKCMDISSSTTCAGVNPDGGDLGSGNSTTSSGSGGLNATQTSIGSSSTFPPYGNQMIMAVCGSDLADAESSCAIACPNKVDMDCPYGQKCFDISHSTSCLGIAPVGSNSSSTVSVTSSGTTTASATNTTSGTGYTTGTGNTLPASNPAGSGSLPGQSYTTGNTLPVSNPTDSGSLPVSGYPSEPDPNAAAAPNAAIPDPAEYDLLEDCEPEIAPAATDLPIFSSDIKLGSGYFGIFVIMLLAI